MYSNSLQGVKNIVLKDFVDENFECKFYTFLGADYMGRVVPLCRVVPAKRVDF